MSTLLPELVALAATQHGMFTTAHATRLGLDRRALTAAVTAGELVHPGRGLYAVAHLVETSPAEAWHRHLAAGATLVYPDAVFCGVTAVLAHGVGVWGCDLAKPSIRRPIHRSTGVTCFRVRRARGAVIASDWGPTATIADALVQLAIDHGIEPGVVSADAALRVGLVTTEEIDASIEESTRTPGIHRARTMAAYVCAKRESAGESRCGFALELAGIHVVPQVQIRDSFGNVVGRVDFLVEGTRVVVEFDGKLKFASGDPEVLWAEKKREDRLRALGYIVVRITWADLERGTAVAKVRAAMARAAAA